MLNIFYSFYMTLVIHQFRHFLVIRYQRPYLSLVLRFSFGFQTTNFDIANNIPQYSIVIHSNYEPILFSIIIRCQARVHQGSPSYLLSQVCGVLYNTQNVRVRINIQTTTSFSIKTGLPYGNVLGPFFFCTSVFPTMSATSIAFTDDKGNAI